MSPHCIANLTAGLESDSLLHAAIIYDCEMERRNAANAPTRVYYLFTCFQTILILKNSDYFPIIVKVTDYFSSDHREHRCQGLKSNTVYSLLLTLLLTTESKQKQEFIRITSCVLYVCPSLQGF